MRNNENDAYLIHNIKIVIQFYESEKCYKLNNIISLIMPSN